ncbi:IS481 family transposase [Corynebacterium sp. 320]|uniref:IS481 family transposase n=1 Tax=Corynebacterium TaxID=1716 RepID=UPI00125CA902|nr:MULTISPECIES: IS481 family transposase [Corynebacterium]KAB1500952.1 IS481 family transposase [Corynebacterium sp. 320]KAB1551757.1 IS481 family transposase [Corynebacterium sp. 319]KAB3525660.1 IS481 family transposase [Corynebacterium sp. 250]KAB3538752.1 IS481 family transposase [Corynebacterium sp. 366]QNP92171.1 IS481 family transposase [Corynebacterium zhongnanshanii]
MSYNNPNLAIVTAIRKQHMTVSQAAKKFKRSRQWIYTLLDRYDHGGPDAVQPRSKAPKTSPTKIPDTLADEIVAIRKELTSKGADNGPESIAWVLQQRGLRSPAESTIRRILTTRNLITPQPHKRPKASLRRFAATLPNECWQADVTYVRLRDGRTIEVLDFLDDHSRYLLYLTAFYRVHGPTVVTAIEEVTATYGLPQSTLTDNGLIFTARLAGARGGKTGFEKFLETHSIKQKNGRPAHPQTQGKIERFHQTLKKWLKARPPAETLPQLQALLDEFRTWYNNDRPHRALGRNTPHQAYNALPKASPQPLVTEDNRVRHDKVDTSGRITLRFAGKLRYLGIGRSYAGTPTLTVITGNTATTTNATTGELIAEHIIDTQRQYQPKLPKNTQH